MYSSFKEQAIEYVKQAIKEDTEGNYAKAFPLYMNALEYFRTHLKYENNPKIKEAIELKLEEYLRRAEEIRAVLDNRGPGPAPAPIPSTGVEPFETSSSTHQLTYSFVKQGMEYAKQAVDEDNSGNYAKAFPLYMNALEYFRAHLKYEKNPKIEEALSKKFNEYLRRAEEIRAVLDLGGTSSSLKDGHGGDKDDDSPTTK